MQMQSQDFAYDCCTTYKVDFETFFETMIEDFEVSDFQTTLQLYMRETLVPKQYIPVGIKHVENIIQQL